MNAAYVGLVFGIVNYGSVFNLPLSSIKLTMNLPRFGLPAYWLEDRIGRATLLLIGLPNMAWIMLVLAFCFKLDNDNPAKTPLIYVCF